MDVDVEVEVLVDGTSSPPVGKSVEIPPLELLFETEGRR